MSHMIERLEKFTNVWSIWFNWIAGFGVVAMLGITVVDIIANKLFKNPVPGGIENVAYLGVVVAAFAVAYTQITRGHIQVEFLVMRLPRRAQESVIALVSLLGIVLFAMLAWRSYAFARSLQVAGEVSPTQRIPYYPLVYAMGICFIPVCLTLLVGFLKSIRKAVTQ